VIEPYKYPDNEDQILCSFVRKEEPYSGYWTESDEGALAQLGNYLADRLPAREFVNAIDAGCGWGRGLPWVAKFAERIIAVDPDPSRLAEARKYESLAKTRLSFENISIGEVQGGPYELIVCNHVIQHVSTSMTQRILSKFRDLATPSTILVMSFSRSPVGKEFYGVSCMKEGVPGFEKIDRSDFNRLADMGGSPGYLPVRMIDPDLFSADALAVGWQTCWSWTYHSIGWPGAELGAGSDEIVNQTPSLLHKSQGDIYVVMRLGE